MFFNLHHNKINELTSMTKYHCNVALGCAVWMWLSNIKNLPFRDWVKIYRVPGLGAKTFFEKQNRGTQTFFRKIIKGAVAFFRKMLEVKTFFRKKILQNLKIPSFIFQKKKYNIWSYLFD